MYQVVDTNTKKAVATGFKNRETAKKDRNKRNGGPPKDDDDAKLQHIVSRGENHPRGASFGPVANQSKRWL